MNEDELVLSTSFCPFFLYLLEIIIPGLYEIPRFYIYVNHHTDKELLIKHTKEILKEQYAKKKKKRQYATFISC